MKSPEVMPRSVQVLFALFHQFEQTLVFRSARGVNFGSKSNQRIVKRFSCALVPIQPI
jgi:hypothetical protein